MATTTLPEFLRERRERLTPPSRERRRTKGLRREEVATRAGVSVTWYTWLEQGRGGVPSEDVLERLSIALELDATNREMLFLLAHGRPPPIQYAEPASVSASLQRVLDHMQAPAFIKTPTYQIVAWNRAAVAVIGDYGALPERERNVLRRVFHADAHTLVPYADDMRAMCIAAFRVDVARARATEEAGALVDELLATNEEFRRLWRAQAHHSHGVQHRTLLRPSVGALRLEVSVFPVEDSNGLSMVVLTPLDDESAKGIAALVREHGAH